MQIPLPDTPSQDLKLPSLEKERERFRLKEPTSPDLHKSKEYEQENRLLAMKGRKGFPLFP